MATSAKFIFAIVFFCSLSLVAPRYTLAQSKIGISLSPGIGSIYSPTLNNLQNAQVNKTPQLTSASAASGLGFNMGLGVFYQYAINKNVAVLLDPSFNILFSKIYMNSKYENLDKNGSGKQVREEAKAKITTMYIHVPLLFKYTFFQKRKLYLLAGGAMNMMLQTKLNSQETTTKTKYGFERITETEVLPTTTYTTSIDKGNPLQFSAVVGFGRQFRKGLKNISLDFTYSHPLVGGTFYSSSSDLKQAKQNSIFGEAGKMESESKSPQFSLNDFKMGVFNLTLRFTLKKFDKNTSNKKIDSTALPTKAEIVVPASTTSEKSIEVAPTNTSETKAEKKARKKKEAEDAKVNKEVKESKAETSPAKETVIAPTNTSDTFKEPTTATETETKAEMKARIKKEAEEAKKAKQEKNSPKAEATPAKDTAKVAAEQPLEIAPPIETKAEKKARKKKEAEDEKAAKGAK